MVQDYIVRTKSMHLANSICVNDQRELAFDTSDCENTTSPAEAMPPNTTLQPTGQNGLIRLHTYALEPRR